MATCYFLCGGPFELTEPIESLFPGFHVVPEKTDSVWSNCDEHEISYAIVDGFWVVNGDSNDVFRLGPHFCKQVSASGEAGEFYAQNTSDYYEIVLYRNGTETKRLFSFEDGPGDRKNVTLAELDTDDMWTYSSKILPVPWEEIYDRPGVWLRKDGYENSRVEQGGDTKRGWRRWFASLWRG